MNAPEISSHSTAARWHHQHPVRIYWEDTDAGGIVFYGNYLKFMERARTEWLRALGFDQEGMRHRGEGMFVVAETQLRYLQPARLDDLLNVTVALVERGRVSMAFQQEVRCGDQLLATGRIRIGWVQALAPAAEGALAVLRPGRVPQAILACLPEPIHATSPHA